MADHATITIGIRSESKGGVASATDPFGGGGLDSVNWPPHPCAFPGHEAAVPFHHGTTALSFDISAAVELRKMFPGIADESGSGVCVHHGQRKARPHRKTRRRKRL
jgi:hypothetical protein